MISKYFNPYTDFGFKKLFGEVSHLSSEQYDDYLKSILSYNEAKSMTDTAFFDGEKKGIEKGKIEAMQSAAKVLKSKGIAHSIITLSTGLTEPEIESLK
ncbi:MAG: hypothetical protein WCL34_04505 [Methylococcaceae bacterium]